MRSEQQTRSRNETACYCEVCKLNRGEKNDIRPAPVHNYSYKPREWRKLSLPHDEFPYHMGVELETSTNPRSESVLWQESAVGLRRPKSLWFAKYDASVTGPEFVSHPATLPYWHDKAAELTEMFQLLIHAGYRSHNGGQAGMHVNISKSAFADIQHLHRFLTFLYVNMEWSLVMSQRTDGQASEWAAMRPYTLDLADRMLGYRYSPTGKYSVVHAPDYTDRLEFRLPRGTLRLDRFYKNLEWTAALIAFTRLNDYAAHNELYPTAFTSWVFDFPMVYENLRMFLLEKDRDLRYAADTGMSIRHDRMEACAYDPEAQGDVYGPPKPSPSDLAYARRRLDYQPVIHTYTTPTTLA